MGTDGPPLIIDSSIDTDVPDDRDAGGSGSTVFVTSTQFSSAFGGLSGADALCLARALGAGLDGEYQAILSDATGDAAARLNVIGPIVDRAGTTIARTRDELWSGTLLAPIDVDERGQPVQGGVVVWSGTDADGVADRSGSGYCGNWTGLGGGVDAGRVDRRDGGWISIYGDGTSAHACSNQSRLYCIQTF